MSAAAKVLDRLQAVKPTGPGRWLARCPAHEDKRPSLSVRELDDGRLLLHDFGGCDTSAVLDSLGLQLGDLFPERLGQQFSPTHSRIPARDILAVIDEELLTAVTILDEIVARRAVSPTDVERLALAAGRIGRAKEQAHGR